MSTEYELIYFPIHGKASPIRMVLEDHQVNYKMTLCTKEDWPSLKPQTTFGQLPILVYHGTTRISQSKAILRFVGGRLGLMGSDDVERALISMYMEQAYDSRIALVTMLKADYENGLEPFVASIPTLLKPFESKLSEGSGEHLINEKLTVADYSLFDLILIFKALRTESIDSAPMCKKFFNNFAERPRIKAYLERPDIKNYKFNSSERI